VGGRARKPSREGGGMVRWGGGGGGGGCWGGVFGWGGLASDAQQEVVEPSANRWISVKVSLKQGQH